MESKAGNPGAKATTVPPAPEPSAPAPATPPKGVNVSHWKEEAAHNDWCPGCVLPDTVIVTNPGAQRIDQVQVGDRVLTAQGTYGRVAEVMKHRHRGTMYRLRPKAFAPFTLTPEHPVLAVARERRKHHNSRFAPTYVEAERLRPGDYVAFPVPREVVDLPEMALDTPRRAMDRRSAALPDRIPLTPAFLRLAGYYLAEGHVHRREICLTFHARETAYVRDVARTVRGLFGVSATTRERSERTTLEAAIGSSRLARFFGATFGRGAANKCLPHSFMQLPPTKQRALLVGLWRGDGWFSPTQRRATYKTISRVLAEQVKILLLRQGIVPTMTEEAAKPGHRASYTINVVHDEDFASLARLLGRRLPSGFRPSGRSRRVVFDGSHVFLPLRKIETFPYDGMVYNLVVDGDPSYVTSGAAVHNCGDFGILNAVQMALAELNLENHQVALFSGIGCSGKISHFVRAYGVHTLHGRVLPFATGAKLANPQLNILAVGGDGDGLGIGAGHFVGAGRRNVDIAYIIHDNQVYGLTKGQASPTLPGGAQPKSLPVPNINNAVNPLALALATGYTWIGRGYAYDIKNLKELIKQAITHKGMAFLDVFQPCPTYNNLNTKEWYAGLDRPNKQPRTYRLAEEGYDGKVKDPTSEKEVNEKRVGAYLKMVEGQDRLGLGVFYAIDLPTFEDKIAQRIPGYAKTPPAKEPIVGAGGKAAIDVAAIMDESSVKQF